MGFIKFLELTGKFFLDSICELFFVMDCCVFCQEWIEFLNSRSDIFSFIARLLTRVSLFGVTDVDIVRASEHGVSASLEQSSSRHRRPDVGTCPVSSESRFMPIYFKQSYTLEWFNGSRAAASFSTVKSSPYLQIFSLRISLSLL